MNEPAAPNGEIRVLLVDDDDALREGMRFLIDATDGFRAVGSFGSATEALRAAVEPAPDVVLLDVQMPGLSGPEAVPLFAERYPGAAILMLTVYGTEEQIFASLCGGACGFLLKKTPPARLLELVREAHGGGAPFSPEVARKVVHLFRELKPPARSELELTAQEIRLLGHLAGGHTYQTAAREMTVSINTVRNYIRSIYDKLHVHSKSEAVSKALRAGLL